MKPSFQSLPPTRHAPTDTPTPNTPLGDAFAFRRCRWQVCPHTCPLITGRELPGISGRAETTLFDLDDLITAGGLSNLKGRVHDKEVEETDLHQSVKTMIEDGASDRKICAILGIHARLAKEIRSTLGMSLSAPSTISTLIAGGAHVPNSIIGLVGAGTDTTKDILSALQQEHGIDTEAGKKRLQRMVRSGELIRSGRGRYALPDAGSDFLPEGL